MRISTQKLVLENEELNRFEDIIEYGVINFENKELNYPFLSEGVSYIRKKWGFIDMLQSRYTAASKNRYAETVFLGYNNNDSLSIRVFDNEKPISLVGKSFISNNVEMLASSFEAKFLSGVTNSLVHKGNILRKNNSKPKIQELFRIDSIEYSSVNEIRNNVLKNDFFNESILIDYKEKEISGVTLKGNIILKTDKPLLVRSNNNFEDIIVLAPEVIVEEGFVGTLQIFCSKSIIIMNGVKLVYPSVLCAMNEFDTTKISINKNSDVKGVLICDGRDDADSYLDIERGVQVVGDVFCSGIVSLSGELKGTIYTQSFYLDTDESFYENTILNCNINSRPKDFLSIPFLENDIYGRGWGIIKRRW